MGSIPLMGSGLHVLGQEFEAAKDAEEKLMESVETARIAVMEKVDAAKKQLDELKQNNPAVTKEGSDGISPSLTSASSSFPRPLLFSEQNRLVSNYFGRNDNDERGSAFGRRSST